MYFTTSCIPPLAPLVLKFVDMLLTFNVLAIQINLFPLSGCSAAACPVGLFQCVVNSLELSNEAE